MPTLTRGMLVLAAMTLLQAVPAVAQNGGGVSGTITLDPSTSGRVQVITTRRARLGVLVAVEATPVDSIGALIVAVTPNGPAYRAGLQTGDIVVRLNGRLLTEVDRRALTRSDASVPGVRMIDMVAQLSPGDSTTLLYRRDKIQKSVTLVVGDEPNSTWTLSSNGRVMTGEGPMPFTTSGVGGNFEYKLSSDSMFFKVDTAFMRTPLFTRMRTPMPRMWLASPLSNLEIAPLNPELGRYFGVAEGVLVINIPSDTKLGLRPGDVVLSVDGRETRSPARLMNALMSYEPGENFTFQIMRQKSKMSVTGMVEQR